MPFSETPTKGPAVNAAQKKALVRFVVAGAFALLLSKVETLINDKADDYFGPDAEQNN